MSASEENITRYSHASKSTLKGTGMQTYPLAEVYLQKHECQKTKRDTQKLKNYSKQEQNYMFDVPHGFVEGTSSPERKVQKTVHTVVHHEDQRHEKFDGRDAALEVVIPQIHFEDKYEEFPQAQSHPSNIKKNFQLPTVSSKMKQVNRNYFQRFNFRNIPFVAGTSTSPSYNLRLNFQQILSIIKMRHPVAGGVRHLFGGHQMGAPSMPQFCPRALSHKPFCATTMHGDILEIPEKDEETNFVRDTDLPSQHIRSRPASAAPFLNEFVEHNSDPWAIEQCDSKNKNNSSMRCTCFPPRRYVNYQDILNQYLQDGERPSFFKSAPPECQVPYRVQPLRTHYSTMSRGHDDRVMAKSVVSGHSTGDQHLTDNMKNAQRNNDDITLCKTKDKNPNFFVDIQGRTKSLKEVLINLHEDFSRLNSKYEELQTGVTQDTVDETEAMKELEAMETELQAKEDEITVVMALYKEVISLKEQVRALRKRASSANFTNQTTRIRPHHITVRPPTVGVRLTKLLRVIQQFQDELKHD
ncbi:uncharacterized protein [Periplaneta americana]|uniref:uncharacterized protein n=1 Tax=Periplaneta americana TaxID=6978 RepID=UPI0037E919C2